MQSPKMSFKNMMVAPHHLASKTGADIMKEGGNAVEAMIASAAMISVVYPHMNSMGGDNFWLISDKNNKVSAIEACGSAAKLADIEFYKRKGFNAIPTRGSLAALTVPGAVGGWKAAYDFSVKELGGKLPLSRLLYDAEQTSKNGIAVTNTLSNNLKSKYSQLKDIPGFNEIYLSNGKLPIIGNKLTLPAMSETFASLIKNGFDDFYNGDLANKICSELERLGSPLRINDFLNFKASFVKPLNLKINKANIYNLPPPTQGIASLLILGVLNNLSNCYDNDFSLIHNIVEATKVAFKVRDNFVCDPDYMSKNVNAFLESDFIKSLSDDVDQNKALPWPDASVSGDTVWLGASDNYGNSVSFIQSIYWEFGSGLILPETGITMQNRGISFSLDENHFNKLIPGRRPFHTIQPALAHFDDGRVMPYGTMGGEGQPQTQATIFSRYAYQNLDLQSSIDKPRWLLGKTWGDESTSLKIENRFSRDTYDKLKSIGHNVELLGEFEEVMGHAGAIVRHPNGLIEGAFDLRSDGSSIGE
ncbi:gamma-glutamyltransferase family protein [Alphaproteobacteria bacterium]|nr:gamma-glutamyltransferase family protein [Alphaproteobacteria bacterium]